MSLLFSHNRYHHLIIIGYIFLNIAGCANETIHLPPPDITGSTPIIPANYLIGPSDELEILYFMDPEYTSSDYTIDTEDKLHVDFYYYPNISKTVTVRPDGFITLPKIGDLKAAGEKPRSLAKKISKLFTPHLSQPNTTVELVEFNVKLERLKDAIRTSGRGQSKLVVVKPDGRISLPFLKNDIIVAGKTTVELGRELEKKYREKIKNINITASLLEANSYQTCILGDVKKPNYYSLSKPTTLLQLISRAGGFTNEANIRQVVIITPGKKGKPKYTVKNLEAILKKGVPDPIIHQYDVVYVPRTRLSKAAFTAKEILSLIPINFMANIYDTP